MRAQFEVLIFRVTSVRYCLISQNGQVVENWRSASRTEIQTTDLAAMEITVYHQDDNHEVQRPTDWPVQVQGTYCIDKFCIRVLFGKIGWIFNFLFGRDETAKVKADPCANILSDPSKPITTSELFITRTGGMSLYLDMGNPS
ncbi:hypothetical protein AVEN_198178-1 [Araneus ventricosus]|uniref:Uncharacterized protein n=1 Tax=Araneus ventricosus TaxID=182803 RepID=A0A4Y2N5M5_ARAVE|nr:hypothetical protein AVEN_198178-1 [Araneus ventricosus]